MNQKQADARRSFTRYRGDGRDIGQWVDAESAAKAAVANPSAAPTGGEAHSADAHQRASAAEAVLADARRRRVASGYIAGSGLRHAVNVALALDLPLLLTGEPGTGKT